MTLDLLAAYGDLSPEDRASVDRLLDEVPERWIPQPGPQADAYFSEADELLYGGAAGGGKSDLLIGWSINEAENAVIYRNGLKNVRDLENRAVTIEGHKDGFSSQIHYWDRGGGKSLEFGSLEQPGSESDWQGRRRDFMGFDETAQMLKARVQFVLGWSGSAKNVRTRVIYATNPPMSDEGNWLIVWFAPWLDPLFPKPATAGELRWFVNNDDGDPIWVEGPGEYDRGGGKMAQAKSRTFIPSLLKDNAFLRDTDYRSRLENLPEPMRSAMLNGNFMAARVDHAHQLIPSDWVRKANARWKPEGNRAAMIAIGADVAGGGPDREVIARLHVGNHFDAPLVHKGVDTKDGHAVAGRLVAAQRNGAPVGIDMTGGWGGGAKTALADAEVDVVSIVFSSVTGAVDAQTQFPFGNLRAEMMWNFRLALDPATTDRAEWISLPLDPRLLAELTAPRWFLKGGKIWVESKIEIKERLGASTDLLDAYVIAWHIRGRGLIKRKNGNKPRWANEADNFDPHAFDGF